MDDRYAAGFFDGEGCVILNKRTLPGSSHSDYNLQVMINNTSLETLERFSREYGGKVVKMDNSNPSNGPVARKQMYRWWIPSSSAVLFLRRIYPFLIEKKSQVWLALEYREQISGTNGKRPRVTENEVALREGYYLALQLEKRAS